MEQKSQKRHMTCFEPCVTYVLLLNFCVVTGSLCRPYRMNMKLFAIAWPTYHRNSNSSVLVFWKWQADKRFCSTKWQQMSQVELLSCIIPFFHFLLHHVYANDEASTRLHSLFIPCAFKSSFRLSIYFFGCLPLLLVPFTCLYSATVGSLSYIISVGWNL